MVLAAQAAVTPIGKPVAVPMPVAPVVLWVIEANTVLMHKVGLLDADPTVLLAVTVNIPVALTLPQPPVKGIE